MEACARLADFLHEHAWIFDFSNVKVLSQRAAWPIYWSEFVHDTQVHDLKRILNGDCDSSPVFVREFVMRRNSILAEVEATFVEVLSYDEKMAVTPNRLKRGLSPKKLHEVERFSAFIKSRANCEKIVDVGSGAGHLERVLAHRGFTNEQMACIESSNAHVESAAKWTCSEGANIETIVSTISDSVESFKEVENQLSTFQNGLMVGLHACGDLTNAMIKWFLCSDSFQELAVVSCCFHKMKSFPISASFQSLATPALKSHHALRLSCQDKFAIWNEQTIDQHRFHKLTFGRRAQLEQIAETLHFDLVKKNRHGIRNIHLKSNQEFIQEAIKVYDLHDIEEELFQLFDELHSDDFEWLEVLTGLQAFLQILLEYFVLLDKVMFLKESGEHAQLVQIFDEKISPRCLLLSVVKS